VRDVDFEELQKAVDAAVGNTLVVSRRWVIAKAINLPENIEIIGLPGHSIATDLPDLSLLIADSKRNIRIVGVTFEQSIPGQKAYVAAVHLKGCRECVVEGCKFTGMQWAGVFLNSTIDSRVVGNHFSGFLGTVQDSADICVYRNSSRNTINNNNCQGGNYVGILVQDPYGGTMPSHNVIEGNQCSGHKAYGIVVYQTSGVESSYNRIVRNTVLDVLGSVGEGHFGAGIYVVGAGGTIISENVVRNCCRQTSGRQLAPAGIGINGIAATLVPVTITSNKIEAMSRMDGILVVSSPGGALLTSNTVSMPAENPSAAIRIDGSSNVIVTGEHHLQVTHPSGRVMLVFAQSNDCRNIRIEGVAAIGGGYSQLETLRSGKFVVRSISVKNLVLRGATGSSIPLRLGHGSVDGGNFSSLDVVSSTLGPALHQRECTAVTYSGNKLSSGGSVAVVFEGNNEGTVFSGTNRAITQVESWKKVDVRGSGVVIE